MSVLGVIPARLKSTRLPRKVLLAETGKPLIQHVYEGACKAKLIDRVVIATDDEEVVRACRSFGAQAVMTSPDCACGTDRVAEAARHFPESTLILNVQGDEPEMDGVALDKLVGAMLKPGCNALMGTISTPWPEGVALETPGFVKVVTDREGYALYFSRSVIPHVRDAAAGNLAAQALTGKAGAPVASLYRKHVGLYAYRRDFLLEFATWKPSPLELAESLEQLRAIEAGVKILVAHAEYVGQEVNTAEDYAGFVAREKARQAKRR